MPQLQWHIPASSVLYVDLGAGQVELSAAVGASHCQCILCQTKGLRWVGIAHTVQGNLLATNEVLAAREAGRNAESELVSGYKEKSVNFSVMQAKARGLLTLEGEVQGTGLAVRSGRERRGVLPDLEPGFPGRSTVGARRRARCRHVRREILSRHVSNSVQTAQWGQRTPGW